MQSFTIQDLVKLGSDLVDGVGEKVWDLSLSFENRWIAHDFLLTSQLFPSDIYWIYRLENPQENPWDVEIYDQKEIRLYLPSDLTYSFESRNFCSNPNTTKNKIKKTNFWSFRCLTHEERRLAPFICPFCDKINSGLFERCEHAISIGGSVTEKYSMILPDLVQLLDRLKKYEIIVDFINFDNTNVKIKINRVPMPVNWIWQCYIYCDTVDSAKNFETVLCNSQQSLPSHFGTA